MNHSHHTVAEVSIYLTMEKTESSIPQLNYLSPHLCACTLLSSLLSFLSFSHRTCETSKYLKLCLSYYKNFTYGPCHPIGTIK